MDFSKRWRVDSYLSRAAVGGDRDLHYYTAYFFSRLGAVRFARTIYGAHPAGHVLVEVRRNR